MVMFILPQVSCREPVSTQPTTKQRPATTSTTTAQTTLPRTVERAEDRRRMVSSDIATRGVRNERVLEAMRNVPRHWFVTPDYHHSAYADRALPIGHDQTISQPYIVALMTELLDLQPGERVLEIGTGSGYQAAVLAELTDRVYTIEIVKPLAERTIRLFKEKGYDAIQTRIGDGYRGWPEAAPFDAIIVTCAPDDVPKPLVEQLAVGGRMCIPVGSGWTGQSLILLTKEKDGRLKRKHIIPVRFVPMTGEAQDK